MIPEDRRNAILTLLQEKGYCSVDELASLIYVSVPTIRRDLTQLENEGFLKRVHGGASYNGNGSRVLPFNIRNKQMAKEKMRIGQAAASLLRNQDTVFIDSSTTCLYFAKAIPSALELTVCTNSTIIAEVLSENKSNDVELVCGKYDFYSSSVYGQQAIDYISNRHAKYCFLTCSGLDKSFGLSNSVEKTVGVKQAFMKNAEKIILLIDSSHVDVKGFYKILNLDELDMIITDSPLKEDLMKECIKNRIEVIVA